MPSHPSELLLLFTVSLLVASDFLLPEVGVGLWHLEVFASLMAMPEAAIDEDASAVLPQHKVRMTRETWVIQAIAETTAPEIVSHKQLWLGIFDRMADIFLCRWLWLNTSIP